MSWFPQRGVFDGNTNTFQNLPAASMPAFTALQASIAALSAAFAAVPDSRTFYRIGDVGSTYTLNAGLGTVQACTISVATTFTMPTPVGAQAFTLIVRQSAAGTGTMTFTGVKWNAAGAPPAPSADNADVIRFLSDGVDWYGSVDQGFSPTTEGVSAYVATDETTTSTTFTDLATTTDTVTATIGVTGLAIVKISCWAYNTAVTGAEADMSFMGYALSGANTRSADDNHVLATSSDFVSSGNYTGYIGSGGQFLEIGLSPGPTTFKAKYRCSTATSHFQYRRILVIPL